MEVHLAEGIVLYFSAQDVCQLGHSSRLTLLVIGIAAAAIIECLNFVL